MKTSKCCGRCFYAGKPFRVEEHPDIPRLVACGHPQDHISGTYLDCAKAYWSEQSCFWPRNRVFGRVQNRDGSWRPDVPLWFLRAGGFFFRFAWLTLSNRVLFRALALDNAGVRLPALERWHMFVLQNVAYWDQYAELSDEDKRGGE